MEKKFLSSKTELGVVQLRVKDLNEQVRFYQVALKMTLLEKTEDYAVLGTPTRALLKLVKVENLKRYSNTTGMYHFALLYPNEKELAKAVYWLFSIKYPNSPTDHGMSKTTYLKDLEGNDIELYIRTLDRANYVEYNGEMRLQYKDGTFTDGRDPLDLDELFSHLNEEDDIKSDLTDAVIGHVHLYGSNIDNMLNFYHNVVGFKTNVIERKFMMGDVGLDENQNHVIAFNSWKRTNNIAPNDAAGLDFYTILLDNQEEYDNLLTRLNENNTQVIKDETGTYFTDTSGIKVKIDLK